MPNEKNLIPMDQRSKNEARELGREGGRASGVARRRKKKLREAAELYLSLPVVDKRVRNKLLRAGSISARAAGRIRQGYRVLARKDGEHYIIRVEEVKP